MELFVHYIKQRWRGIVLGVVFVFVFLVSFLLYHLPVEAVMYPAVLCILFGLIVLIMDFRRVKHKYQVLRKIHSLTDMITGNLPMIEGVEEKAYQQMLHLICEEYNEYRAATERRYTDMIDYYSVWVHQIKTPIASMRLHLQNEDSAFARKLSTDLFRIEQYVEMVLTFLRLDADSTDYVIREYDLDEIVKQAVKKFSGEFIGRKLSLRYEPFGAAVITDEKWLSFVIEQVLSNALKYTPSGSISITLEPDKRLCIRDTGIGIASEDLPRIFDNGYTGYNGRMDKKASGIGLYLCRRICTNLGHTIKAESVIGEGTVIIIDLAKTQLGIE